MEFVNILPGVESAASALSAEKVRMEVIAQNIANANTTRTSEGGPYTRQMVKFEAFMDKANGIGVGSGPHMVRVAGIESDTAPPRKIYQPGHPDADDNGMVSYPNINIHLEMADLIASNRAMEANLAIIRTARAMAMNTLSLGK